MLPKYQLTYTRLHDITRSRESVVSLATSYRLNGREVGVLISVGCRIFSKSSRSVLRSIQPPIQLIPGALSPGVKRPSREVDHSPPTSAEVKKNVNLYIHSPIRLHGVVLN
jgi:hypothetical protein